MLWRVRHSYLTISPGYNFYKAHERRTDGCLAAVLCEMGKIDQSKLCCFLIFCKSFLKIIASFAVIDLNLLKTSTIYVSASCIFLLPISLYDRLQEMQLFVPSFLGFMVVLLSNSLPQETKWLLKV